MAVKISALPQAYNISDSDYTVIDNGASTRKIKASLVRGVQYWQDLTGKPFSSIGTNLAVDVNGKLNVQDVHSIDKTEDDYHEKSYGFSIDLTEEEFTSLITLDSGKINVVINNVGNIFTKINNSAIMNYRNYGDTIIINFGIITTHGTGTDLTYSIDVYTKTYVPEAPSDNVIYGRKNETWVEVESGGSIPTVQLLKNSSGYYITDSDYNLLVSNKGKAILCENYATNKYRYFMPIINTSVSNFVFVNQYDKLRTVAIEGVNHTVTYTEENVFPTWSELDGKPFETIGNGLSVVNDELSAELPSIQISDSQVSDDMITFTSEQMQLIQDNLGKVINVDTSNAQTYSTPFNSPFFVNNLGDGIVLTSLMAVKDGSNQLCYAISGLINTQYNLGTFSIIDLYFPSIPSDDGEYKLKVQDGVATWVAI